MPPSLPAGFVDLRTVLPAARFSIGYATPDNFTGAPLPGYGAPGAWMLEGAAESLLALSRGFAAQGFGVEIYDAYRPVRATDAMIRWCETHDATWLLDQGYVSRTSRHNTGNTVDLSLWTLDTGTLLDMGTAWATFHPDSHTVESTGTVLTNRLRLREPMLAAGWQGYSKEWWHFNYVPFNGRPRLDVPYG